VCEIVGASLFAIVSAFILIKGIEFVFDRLQAARSLQEQAYGARSSQHAKQASKSSRPGAQATQRPPAGALSADSAGAAARGAKALEKALKARGAHIATRLDPRVLEPVPMGKKPGPEVAIA